MKKLFKVKTECCGKMYGASHFAVGFLIFGILGFFVSHIIYGILFIDLIFSVISGLVGSRIYVKRLVSKREKEFVSEFCDYLDSFTGSLSGGRNSYDSFLEADEDICQLYGSDAPICVESSRLVDGLKSGRAAEDMLRLMAKDTGCEDVYIFSDVYALCNTVGGDLKLVTADIKNVLLEKIAVETEIQTELSEPKNELNIMILMPLVISLMLRLVSGGAFGESSIAVNTVAVMIFVFSYALGQKLISVKV